MQLGHLIISILEKKIFFLVSELLVCGIFFYSSWKLQINQNNYKVL